MLESSLPEGPIEQETLQPDFSTPHGYLSPEDYPAGISDGYANAVPASQALLYMDDFQYAQEQSTNFPMPYIKPGGKYAFGDGSLTALSITWLNDPTDGLYRVGSHDQAYVVNGVVVTEWKSSTEFRVNYMTAGSVFFAGTSGKVSQNNAAFFWDGAFLGIGTNVPLAPLHIKNGVGAASIQLEAAGTLCDLTLSGGNLTINPDSGVTITQSTTVSKSFIGSTLLLDVSNSDNTNGASNARFDAIVGGASGGDPYLHFLVTGVTDWSIGIDNSDSDKLKISKNATLGTNDYLTITTAGDMGINQIIPRRKLDILDTAAAQLRLTYTDNSVYSELKADSLGNLIITSSADRVGIVGGAPSFPLDVGYSGSAYSLVCRVYSASAAADRVGIMSLRSSNGSSIGGDPIFDVQSAAANLLKIQFNGSVILNSAALAASATDGFLYIAGMAGAPSGTPTAFTGRYAETYDSTNDIWYRYNSFWRSPVGQEQANGQQLGWKSVTELTTIAAAATTDTAIQIPVDAIVLGVTVRVTVVIPTAATFTVTGTTSATQYDVAGGVSTAATTTDVGTRNCPYKNGAAQTIRITPNAVPANNSGRVRVTIHYYKPTPATS